MPSLSTILGGKYRLLPPHLPANGPVECRLALDEYETAYLVKLWRYSTPEPDELLRALWDSELRTLYRVSSSPGAEDTILVVRDARLDRDNSAFAMVLESYGVRTYETLAQLLPKRNTIPWLSNRDVAARREMWSGLKRLSEGLRLLHHQNVLHRNLTPETVFLDSALGSTSLRLGGFEWSIRLGVPQGSTPPAGWATPPEFFVTGKIGYRPETDWYAFGMLAIRCLLNVEEHGLLEPRERHARVLRQLEASTAQLSDIERRLLLRLIATDPRDRLAHGNDIGTGLVDVIKALDFGGDPQNDSRPLVLVIDPANDSLVSDCQQAGYVPNPKNLDEGFNPLDLAHTAALAAFIQDSLANAQLYAIPNSEVRLLIGDALVLKIAQFQSYTDSGEQRSSWDLAFCFGTGELRRNEGGAACNDLPESSIAVRTRRQVARERTIRQQAQSWEPFLPSIDRTQQLRRSLSRFHEFIRCTNQLELLMRDAEIFAYELQSCKINDDGVESAVIREIPRQRPPFHFFRIEGGLVEFLHSEIETNKQFCRQIVLTPLEEDGLYIPSANPAECWQVADISDGDIRLVRGPFVPPLPKPPQKGCIRAFGMFGQVALIRRRKKAIDRLETHSYLLRSLSSPGQVYMDTGETPLPAPPNLEEVDAVKQTVMQDIIRVRPIYSLQGPPGTGKTTLVAHLVRQILEDDPVAQILITAQAHGAVDVLRAKVRNEAFRNVGERRQPLAVRLGKRGDVEDEGSVSAVSEKILEGARTSLSELSERSPVQDEWYGAVREMLSSLERESHDSSASDFVELVRRSANLTYCTTSAGDLEELAEGSQSFDWSIVEESGKAHGFDLALPLQAGHRWLLIGDHKQLPPYRIRDYRDGIDNLDDAVTALKGLHERAASLVDFDWIRRWDEQPLEECDAFKEYARNWLEVFEHVFQFCRKAPGVERMTAVESPGAAAGMLSHQYRMHPSIGELISEAYYDRKLVHKTQSDEGVPYPRIQHPFIRPEGIKGRAICWVDVPWCQHDDRSEELGPRRGMPRYTNPSEIEAIQAFLNQLTAPPLTDATQEPLSLVVLSPYSQQVRAINRRLGSSLALPEGVSLTTGLRPARQSGAQEESRLAHTVDSFQGNEADIVLVSLVRNNALPPEEGLGFLEESARINVLLSRAEQLLVLVGSWDFFVHQVSTVRLEDSHHPLWHLKRVVTTLDQYFASGLAVRLKADSMPKGL